MTSFIWNTSRGLGVRAETISFASLQKNTMPAPSAEPVSPYFFVTSLSVLACAAAGSNTTLKPSHARSPSSMARAARCGGEGGRQFP